MSRKRSKPLGTGGAVCPIAVIGIGCRFPGSADDWESFWKLLADGRSGIREIPADRWNSDRYYHTDPSIPDAMITRGGGFVDNLDKFDARFWGITPREARRMDPQQRWLLEVAWEAIEDSGTPPQRLRGADVGVFVGIAANDYGGLQVPYYEKMDAYTNSGSTLSIASNRISYLFDLKGPSVSVDTACSSALVGVWMACENIWAGRCAGALVGGVNAVITPHATIGFSKASMLSRAGQCFAFDARANGYVRGEGAGMVYLKPLEQALADRDRIYAVIRAAVCNQDGHTSSMTVPGVEGQSAMLREAYEQAGLSPARVAYVEAHGTGTPVGDPVEATALGRVLAEGRPPDKRCLIGSVKTNIGHLEAASGIAGLIKAALVLHNRTVPANLNFETPNPQIPFDDLRLEVASRLRPLPQQDGTLPVTAVNSFGFGGTNAHVVLEAAPVPSETRRLDGQTAEQPYLLPVSARDDEALRRYVEAYRDCLTDPSLVLADVCHSAGARKEHHDRRLVVFGRDSRQMCQRMGTWLRTGAQVKGVITGRAATADAPLVFVFTGQGAQWWAMGRQLLQREPTFRRAIEEIDAIFQPLSGWSLLDGMRCPEEESEINRTDVAQPAIFALQVALTELWKAWGVRPAKTLGHSVGEVAAAYCAGVHTLEDAVKIIFHRSRLQSTTRGQGRMVAVGMSADEAREAIGDDRERVQIAAVNSPYLVTLSGDTEPLEEVTARLEQAGKFVRWLRIEYAFHTHQMEPIKDELLDVLADVQPRQSRIPFISTVTGGVLDGERLDAQYWWTNVRQPVLFGPAVSSLVRENDELFVELGPHPALEGPVKECLAEQGRSGAVFHSLRRETDESLAILTNLAGLHVHGVPIDWATVNHDSGNFVRLPRYPWSHESFWLESKESAQARLAAVEHPLLGLRVTAAEPTWQFELDPRRFAYLDDHRFWDSIVFPASGYCEIGIALARAVFPDESHAVEDLVMHKALFVSESDVPTIQVVFDETDKTFSVYSGKGEKEQWELHAQGRLTPMSPSPPAPVDLRQLRQPLDEHFDRRMFYEVVTRIGYQFGTCFQHLQELWRVRGEALAEIVVPEAVAETVDQYHFHPAVLDGCFHVSSGVRVVSADAVAEDYLYLPKSIDRIHLYRDKPPTRLWSHARLVDDNSHSLTVDILVYDEQGGRVADILGFCVERVEQKRSADDVDNCFYQFHWEPRRLRGRPVAGDCSFASATEIAAAALAAAPEAYQEHSLDQYHGQYGPRLEAMVCQLIQNAYIELGWQPRVGDRFTYDDFVLDLGVVESHHRLARAHLWTLERHGLLRPTGDDAWEMVQVPQLTDLTAELDAIATQYPQFAAEVSLLERTGPNLAAVLAGEVDPMDVVFPGGSPEHVERFYIEYADFRAYNHLIGVAVARAIKSLPRDRVLRVLEVGAGTGSLTRVALPLLPEDRTEYLLTDLSPAFLAKARSQFTDYPFVECQAFDIEKDPSGQGLRPGGYDLILATDVLHATADLRDTLSNLRACLAAGGLLMFLEVVHGAPAEENVIFGLLNGWWRFTDVELRPHSPLLDREGWRTLLLDCGFSDVDSFSDFPDESKAWQAVFLAFAPDGQAQPTDGQAEPSAAVGTYVVLADEAGVADSLIAKLHERGRQAVCVRRGNEYRQESETEFVVAADSEEDLRNVFTGAAVSEGGLAGVVHCWSLDHPSAEAMSTDDLHTAQQTGVLSALRLVRIFSETPSRVWFVVRDVHHVQDSDPSAGLASAPLVGLLRVANNEHPQCCFTLVDLDANPREQEGEDLFYEATAGDDELEVAYREGRRHCLRLGRVRADELPKRTTDAVRTDGSLVPYRLETDRPGILANLSLNETTRREPGPDEVEVRMQAGGINFRDVMKALGTYPGNPVDLLWFGDDFVGTVERVGENVQHLQPGDDVVGMAPYCFRAYANTDARIVFKKPPHMSFEEGATLPTVFLTAHYALNHVARAQAGEKILIHGAAGGVGQAAVQVAKHIGLEIFATAGTPEKRRLLTEMGVPHVMNSRTLEFADEILEITDGRGVDVVLNSFAGDFIPKSLSVLAPFGRFVEIGKIDVYRNTKIGLQRLKDNISYHVIDLAQHLQHKPTFVAALFAELAERFVAGDYQPLSHTVFPITEVVEAFRFMAQGKHVGKNVLSFDVDEIPIGLSTEDQHRLRAEATYLITGGAGGFCLEVAKWMAQHGARHLVLMTRSGPRDEDACRDIQDLHDAGINVIDARGDVTQL